MKLVLTQLQAEAQQTTVDVPTNRIICVDVSGSMGSELPKLRTHLKNKLPTMVMPQDTVTIIWFSGRNECGILFEAIKLDTLQDLSKVNAAIDRYLAPVGMTGFKQPLVTVLELTKRLSGDCALSFMTDGYNNADSTKEIMEVCSQLADKLSFVTFVEYGFYADHQMLMNLAEEVGGAVILAENFQGYSESLESSLKSQVSGKKIKLNKIKAGFVIGNSGSGFVIARPDAVGTVTLPANTTSYSYLEGTGDLTEIEHDEQQSLQDAAFAVAALIQRGSADQAMQLASVIGDVALYQKVENSFSKQDYAVAVELATAYGTGKVPLYSTAPRAQNLSPDVNAYNVLTLLMDLASEEGNYLDLSHPDFNYNPIGSKRETAVIGEGADAFTPVFENKPGQVKAEITALKFDEDRPNISILVKRDGTVTLPPNELGFKDNIESYIWRNYAIVKDGIVNVRKLPVILSKATYDLFTKLNVINEPFKIGKTFVIDTKKYPIINRSMAAPIASTALFKKCFDLYVARVKQKVLGTKVEKAEVGDKFAALYGDDGAKFLKNLGISEGGFSPKTVKGVQIDPYISKVLEIKLAGLSSIPTVADVEKALSAKKTLTPAQKVMADVLAEVAGMTDYKAELAIAKLAVRKLLNEIVQIKFGVILGKRWFTDLPTIEDNTRELDFGLGKLIKCTALLEDKEV